MKKKNGKDIEIQEVNGTEKNKWILDFSLWKQKNLWWNLFLFIFQVSLSALNWSSFFLFFFSFLFLQFCQNAQCTHSLHFAIHSIPFRYYRPSHEFTCELNTVFWQTVWCIVFLLEGKKKKWKKNKLISKVHTVTFNHSFFFYYFRQCVCVYRQFSKRLKDLVFIALVYQDVEGKERKNERKQKTTKTSFGLYGILWYINSCDLKTFSLSVLSFFCLFLCRPPSLFSSSFLMHFSPLFSFFYSNLCLFLFAIFIGKFAFDSFSIYTHTDAHTIFHSLFMLHTLKRRLLSPFTMRARREEGGTQQQQQKEEENE